MFRSVALLLVVLTSACNTEAPTVPGAIDRNDVEGPDLSDARFLERMSAHHLRAIALASLAAERAQHPELRALGTTIHEARYRELDEMFGWGETWFSHRPNRNMAHMAATNDDVNRLKEAEDFDLAFLDAIERNHEEGLELARDAQLEADHAEVRALANRIVRENGSQLEQMKAWRLTWYPGTPVDL